MLHEQNKNPSKYGLHATYSKRIEMSKKAMPKSTIPKSKKFSTKSKDKS